MMTRRYEQRHLSYTGWDIEFDTVTGRRGGHALLTVILLPSSILLARLIGRKTQDCVCAQFDWLERRLKANRRRLDGQEGAWWWFTSMLTDRGAEMADFGRLERSLFPEGLPGPEGPVRGKVFYCDAYSSWQKPHIEEAHTLLRRVLPKGSWFDHLSQREVDLACSHINSYSREALGGACPFEAAPAGFTGKLMRALGLERIDPDDVCLSEELLRQ